ncbi:MAG: RluA family pseudouridine synthase [Clostridiaceae bacterium]
MRVKIGPNEAGQRVDKFIRKWLKELPLSAIYRAIRKGDIKVNGKKVRDAYFLVEGDLVETKYLDVEKKEEKFERRDNKLKVTYEDENMLIVEKWPGVLVHKDKKEEVSLTDYVLSYLFDKGEYYPNKDIAFKPSPCNRLDRNTSGVVIYAKNFESLKLLNEMIRNRDIKKYYTALVKGRIKDGLYEAYISKDNKNNVSKVKKEESEDSKKIAMDIKTIESCGLFSLVDIELITGRSHQIRAHFKELGHEIVGDTKYGDKKTNNFFINKYGLNYQYLYAYKLQFRNCKDKLDYMENKTLAESLPPIFKKIKTDVFKF